MKLKSRGRGQGRNAWKRNQSSDIPSLGVRPVMAETCGCGKTGPVDSCVEIVRKWCLYFGTESTQLRSITEREAAA